MSYIARFIVHSQSVSRLFPSCGVVAGGGGAGGHGLPSDKFLGVLKSKGGAKILNCQCEISYKICKVQLVNKFKMVVILAFL